MQKTHTRVGEEIRLFMRNHRKPAASWSFQWIFYLAASFYFGAVFLRAILIYGDSADLNRVLALLLIWLALFVSEPRITGRWTGTFPFT